MTTDPNQLDTDQSAALTEAFYQLLVIFIGAIIIACCAIVYAHRVKAEMLPPAVEMPLPVEGAPDFGAAWEGIPTPPFRSDSK